MIAGDSLLVMNSLLENEGLGGQVQTIYFDPPYGIKYRGNWQIVTDNLNVQETKTGISNEPEMIRAYRDTWYKKVHSYLSYMRDRLLLCRKLLTESGSIFVQIGSENVMRLGLLLDEIFGAENRVELITYATSGGGSSKLLPNAANYLLWYAKDKTKAKFYQLYDKKDRKAVVDHYGSWCMVEEPDGKTRELSEEERKDPNTTLKGVKLYGRDKLTSQGWQAARSEPYEWNDKIFECTPNEHWSVSKEGLDRLAEMERLCDKEGKSKQLMRKKYEEEWPGRRLTNIWGKQVRPKKVYVVQTADSTIERCILMTSDPGDLVLDPTCGGGTTAYVAEMWGRRWITIDTSRVALTVARKRLLTACYPYYELRDGISPAGGFVYETFRKITAETLAKDLEPETIGLVDRPKKVPRKRRVTGWFTMEALPAPYAPNPVLPLSESYQPSKDECMDNWRDWLEQMRRSGVRAARNEKIRFEELAEQDGGQWIHASGVLDNGKVCVVVFGSPYALLSGRQVNQAIEEARSLNPCPEMVLFAAFGFDPAVSELLDREKENWSEVEIVCVCINADLLVTDLKGAQPGDDVFWLVGQPDVDLEEIGDDIWQVKIKGFDYYDHKSGKVIPSGVEEVTLWSLDSNYDEKSLYPSQIFFPNARTDKEGWGSLAKVLGATMDEDLLEWYHGDISLPFEAGECRRAAVKIVDRRGVESMVVIPLPESKQVGRRG